MNRRLAVIALALLAACSEPDDRREGDAGTGIRFLAEGGGGEFARAVEPRAFVFPADHGPHPEFRTEWWYFTGNVESEDARHYGFELTFFRVGLVPEGRARGSEWGTGEVWLAHLAVTDTRGRRFVAEERLSRGALGLAGASGGPFRVWVEDWSAVAPSGVLEEGVVLRARAQRAEIELRLEPIKSHVSHGRGGLDAKGPEPGNASYYYSLPRMQVAGTIVDAQGTAREVAGGAWMDREWGTSALSRGVEGWDWFALQLEDGRELMLYRLRDRDGGTNPYSGGSLVSIEGNVEGLGPEDFVLRPREYWTSPATGSRYPIAWDVELPRFGLELEVTPRLRQQEVSLSVRYWEGAVIVTGSSLGEAIAGEGYLELAGY